MILQRITHVLNVVLVSDSDIVEYVGSERRVMHGFGQVTIVSRVSNHQLAMVG